MSSERSTNSSITVHERSARDIAGGRQILLSIENGVIRTVADPLRAVRKLAGRRSTRLMPPWSG